MSTCSFALRRFQVVEVRRARTLCLYGLRLLEGVSLRGRQCIVAADVFDFFFVVVYNYFDLNPGCNSHAEFTDARAAPWLLLERRGQLLGGVVRREQRRIGVAGRLLSVMDAAQRWHCQRGTGRSLRFARPVPHRAGSLAAFARFEPWAKSEAIQAGPVSASWCRGRLSLGRRCTQLGL